MRTHICYKCYKEGRTHKYEEPYWFDDYHIRVAVHYDGSIFFKSIWCPTTQQYLPDTDLDMHTLCGIDMSLLIPGVDARSTTHEYVGQVDCEACILLMLKRS